MISINDKPSWYYSDELREIVIFLTKNCNFNCSYCYVQDKFEIQDKPNLEAIITTLNILLHNKKITRVIITGGETLLYYNILEQIILYLKQNYNYIEIQINTNGSLLNSQRVHFFNTNNVLLNLSLDGLDEMNDKNRRFINNKPTFYEVINNISIDLRNKSNLNIVITPQYKDIYKNIFNLYKLGFKNINLQFDFNSKWSVIDLKNIKLELINFSNSYVKDYLNHSDLKIINLIRLLNILNNNSNSCNYITIENNGNTSSCYMKFIPIEKYDDSNSFTNIYSKRLDILNDLKDKFISKHNNCLNCEVKDYCFCPINSFHINNNKISYVNSNICYFSKLLFEIFLFIKDYLEYFLKFNLYLLYKINTIQNNSNFNLIKNREISKMWFFITTKCNFNCKYCFVKKDKNTLSLSMINNALDYLFLSEGYNKKILIYGGEPLLEQNLLFKLIKLGVRKSKIFKKKVEFSIASNGFLIDNNLINYLSENNVKLSISMGGSEDSHNSKRKLLGDINSFDKILKNYNTIKNQDFKTFNMSALLTVDIDEVENMFFNFNYLINIGFNSINIEPVQNKIWSENEKITFKLELEKILSFIEDQINKENFIYINKINSIYSQKINPQKDYYNGQLNVLSNGYFTDNPLEYFKSGKIIGDVFNGFYKNEKSLNINYYNFIDYNIINIRNSTFNYFLTQLIKKSRSNLNYKNYLDLSLKYVFE